MANRDTIYKELIQLDWEVKDQDEFFDKMTDKLLELGYVKDTFRDAIKTREANYPTALPVEPYPVAILIQTQRISSNHLSHVQDKRYDQMV